MKPVLRIGNYEYSQALACVITVFLIPAIEIILLRGAHVLKISSQL